MISKLDGSFEVPGKEGATEKVQLTETQQFVFNAPAPGTTAGNAPATARGLPAKPPAATPSAPAPTVDAGGRGQKRTRDEEEEDEEEEDSDVAMEEDSDED